MVYAVTRRYRVEDVVYVEAGSKAEAKRNARNSDLYVEPTEAEPIGSATYPTATPRRNLRIVDDRLTDADGIPFD